MRKALIQLGYRDTNHGFLTAFENPQGSEMWLDAMLAKYEGRGKLAQPPPGIRQAPSQAVTDLPAYCFSSELIEAYPEAKVRVSQEIVSPAYTRCFHRKGGFADSVNGQSQDR